MADIIQIGSRNMQNFPLLRECAKTKKPIMLKRHFGCSLRDWLGAAEYILYAGNEKVILWVDNIKIPEVAVLFFRGSFHVLGSNKCFDCGRLGIRGAV